VVIYGNAKSASVSSRWMCRMPLSASLFFTRDLYA